MIWNLLAVLVTGLTLGALAFALRKMTGNRLPKWLIPACAAAGMLGYLAYYDYSWYEFKLGQLPEGSVVIAQGRDTSLLKPWSFVHPAVDSFVVFDGKHTALKQDQQWLVEYFEYVFHKDPIERLETRAFVLNCGTRERVAFDRDTRQARGPLETISRDSPVYRSACR